MRPLLSGHCVQACGTYLDMPRRHGPVESVLATDSRGDLLRETGKDSDRALSRGD